jgi:hypothetical protein
MTRSTSQQHHPLVIALIAAAGATVVIAVVLGALVHPALYAIALVGLVDLWLARRFATGKAISRESVGSAPHSASGVASDDPATAAEADRSYNPYARED